MFNEQAKQVKIQIFLVVIFLIFPLGANAQNQHYSFHKLTPNEGLSQASNDFIYHDSKGFVWLSSIDGLNRFDGKSVKVYKTIIGDSTSLIDNNITSNFFEDAESNLWFTTYKGLHCYVRKTDNFRQYQLVDESAQKLQKNYHAFHLNKTNHLWVRIGLKEGEGKSGQLHLFHILSQKDSIVCPIDGHRNNVILDEKLNVQQVISYRFPTRSGIEVTDMQSPFERQSFFDNQNPEFPSSRIKHILVDTPTIWYLSGDNGLIKFDISSQKYQTWDTYQSNSIGRVASVIDVGDSKIWVATENESILVFDKIQEQFIAKIPYRIGEETALQLERVNKLYKDKQDNVWASSTISGVNYANLNKRKFELPDTFLNHFITAIFERSKGEVFCSYLPRKVAYYASPDTSPIMLPMRSDIISFFENKEGDLFAVSTRNILQWNPQQQQFEQHKELPSFALDVYSNKTGRIILLTYNGIFEYIESDQAASIIPFQALEEYSNTIATAIYEDRKGRIYLATEFTQLLILEKQNGRYTIRKQIDGIGEAKSFVEQDSFLFVASTTGLLNIKTTSLEHRSLSLEEGIPSEAYYSVIADDQENLWLGSNKGIIKYQVKENKYHRFSLADGLQGNEFSSRAFLKTRDGRIWMGGTKGLNRFYPNQIQMQTDLPKVQFTQLLVNDVNYKPEAATNVNALDNLELDYEDNTLSFHFVALEYSDPSNNKFRYRLLPDEKAWVDAGSTGFARYSNLQHGEYTFQIEAANSDGIWNENPKEMNFRVLTPWWMTYWFRAAILFAIATIVYGVFRYQLAQALKMERMRVKISSDLHDDVGGLLSGLAMQSELLELTAPEARKPKLQRISSLSRSAMSRMRDTVWAIDARKDKLENLIDRIREHAAETLSARDISFKVEVENLALDKNMPAQIRQNLYLICKEAITNAAKHSNGNVMEIYLRKQGRNGLLLQIYDNGKFMKKDHKTTGLGMSNMQLRAKQIGASFDLDTSTTFRITISCDRI